MKTEIQLNYSIDSYKNSKGLTAAAGRNLSSLELIERAGQNPKNLLFNVEPNVDRNGDFKAGQPLDVQEKDHSLVLLPSFLYSSSTGLEAIGLKATEK